MHIEKYEAKLKNQQMYNLRLNLDRMLSIASTCRPPQTTANGSAAKISTQQQNYKLEIFKPSITV